MHIVAQAAFIPNYASDFNGTRSTYEDIPQLMRFLEKNKLVIENKSGNKNVYVAPEPKTNVDISRKLVKK